MTTVFTPALLHFVAIFIVATGALMVAAHTALFALAASRAQLSPPRRFWGTLLVGVLLAAWFGWAVLAVGAPVVVPEPAPVQTLVQNPMLLVVMAGMVALGAVALFASRTLRTVNSAMPASWLIGVQFYRVAGVVFLWPFLAGGALPAFFALPAGIGDTLTGLAAPFVALAVARNRPGAHSWAVWWNWFGILDLVVAPATAVLAHSTNVGRFPLVIVPLFLGPPLGILTHLASLRNLATHRRSTLEQSERRAGTIPSQARLAA